MSWTIRCANQSSLDTKVTSANLWFSSASDLPVTKMCNQISICEKLQDSLELSLFNTCFRENLANLHTLQGMLPLGEVAGMLKAPAHSCRLQALACQGWCVCSAVDGCQDVMEGRQVMSRFPFTERWEDVVRERSQAYSKHLRGNERLGNAFFFLRTQQRIAGSLE